MKRFKYITSIVVIVIVLSLSSLSSIAKDKKISDFEKRTLQFMPTLKNSVVKEEYYSFKGYIYELLMGGIFKDWDKYFSDHIFFRETMVDTFNNMQNVLNKEYINDSILGKEEYVFSIPKNDLKLDDIQLYNRAKYFNNIAKKLENSKIYMVNIPSKDMIYSNKIPIDKYTSIKDDYINKILNNIDSTLITKLDFRDVAIGKEGLYYKSDHHWNMEGVYTGYKYIIENIKKDFEKIDNPNSKEFYDIEEFNDCFVGTDGMNVSSILKEKDDLEVYKYKNEKDFEILIDNKEGKFFYEEILEQGKENIIYQVYLNGNHKEVIVNNLKSKNDVDIVMIGDSMDNPLISLMAYHFNKIYSYDLRLYKEDIIEKIQSINPDIVMFIGISDNFINENSPIFKIK